MFTQTYQTLEFASLSHMVMNCKSAYQSENLWMVSACFVLFVLAKMLVLLTGVSFSSKKNGTESLFINIQ